MEIWKDINENYSVSSYGNVKSKERIIVRSNGRTHHVKEKMLSPVIKDGGYCHIHFRGNGENYWYLIHQLVAKAFIPNPNGYEVVHHKDHNPLNNKADNLEWMTKEEHDALHTSVKLKQVYQYTIEGELVKIWDSAKQAAENSEFAYNRILDCCGGRRKTHKGYIWSFVPL